MEIQQAMRSSKKYMLEGEVHVDEFFIGGPEDQKRGSKQRRKKISSCKKIKVTYLV